MTDPSASWPIRNRGWLLIIAGLLLATVLTAWISGGGDHAGRLDPQNPNPDGAQALAQVLGDQGVDVRIKRGADALADQDLADATVLVTSADQLGRSTTRRLATQAAGADLVIVEPDPDLIALLGSRSVPMPVEPAGPVPAQCANTMLTGLEVEVDRADSYPPVPAGCFPEQGGVLYAPQTDEIAFLGAGDALSNDQITRADNAAMALRLLGQHGRLVWYVPDVSDLRAGDEIGLAAVLPRWLEPALWLGGLTLVAFVLWRGRRLGPLVTEPLPVVVKAIETTESRGRLYRKVRDRGYAAAGLRSAARSRAADRLRLPRNTEEHQLVQDVARHTGRSADDIGALLSVHGPAPGTDQDLSTLAGHLADLDEQLRKAPR